VDARELNSSRTAFRTSNIDIVTLFPFLHQLGRSEISIEEEVRSEKGPAAKRSDVRAKERAILKKSHRRWTYGVLAFW
jgi:hypothetical protein